MYKCMLGTMTLCPPASAAGCSAPRPLPIWTTAVCEGAQKLAHFEALTRANARGRIYSHKLIRFVAGLVFKFYTLSTREDEFAATS